eukprot:1184201-Prorocentrum_minimum.AAC.4
MRRRADRLVVRASKRAYTCLPAARAVSSHKEPKRTTERILILGFALRGISKRTTTRVHTTPKTLYYPFLAHGEASSDQRGVFSRWSVDAGLLTGELAREPTSKGNGCKGSRGANRRVADVVSGPRFGERIRGGVRVLEGGKEGHGGGYGSGIPTWRSGTRDMFRRSRMQCATMASTPISVSCGPAARTNRVRTDRCILLLHVTGPPVPITARVHLTPTG